MSKTYYSSIGCVTCFDIGLRSEQPRVRAYQEHGGQVPRLYSDDIRTGNDDAFIDAQNRWKREPATSRDQCARWFAERYVGRDYD